MPYTDAWNTTDPAGTVQANQIDDQIRKLRVELDERLGDVMRGTGMLLDPVQLKAITMMLYDDSQAPGSKVSAYKNPAECFIFRFPIFGMSTDANGLITILASEIPDPKPDFTQGVAGFCVFVIAGSELTTGGISVTLSGDLVFYCNNASGPVANANVTFAVVYV
jgi:hypothetical protein